MELDTPIPFDWELIWFSTGALLASIDIRLASGVMAMMFFGGLFGSWAYQRQLKASDTGQ